LCQVYGRKRVLLCPPFELSLIRNTHHGVYSDIDAESPDLDAFPEFAKISRKEVVLSPGEALFIPVGWWHHVRTLEMSINLAFTNFRAPNEFGWYGPGRVE
jgi:ribosomal protein L16 Arg81 hydroxylase